MNVTLMFVNVVVILPVRDLGIVRSVKVRKLYWIEKVSKEVCSLTGAKFCMIPVRMIWI